MLLWKITGKIMKNAEIKQKISYNRHKFIWGLSRIIVQPVLKLFFGFSWDKPKKLPSPAIIVCNHNSNMDCIYLGPSFRHHMYFIASEQVYRKGFVSKILYWTFMPIAKIKGASDKLTVMKTIRTLREGKNVCFFPEGNRSFNGRTGKSEVATGKLVKVSGANLITYKFEGGYLSYPRWAGGKRKGKLHGSFVNVYTSEQLKDMTAQEITDAINKDIFVDAYATQDKKPIKFKGKKLAEGMETAMCVCPGCKTYNNLKTLDNKIFCTNCKLETTYDVYGYFGEGFKFRTITEWDDWQEEFYRDYISKITDNNTEIFFDDDVGFRTVTADHQTTEFGPGRFAIFRDRYEFTPASGEKLTYLIADIPDVSVFGRINFDFTDKTGTHFEMYTKDRLINCRKYLSGWNNLREAAVKDSEND